MARPQQFRRYLLSRLSLSRLFSRLANSTPVPLKPQPQYIPNDKKDRYDPCRILFKTGIPCLVWGEDALTAHSIPTIVSDLFLLVHDPEDAAAKLRACGFVQTRPNPRFNGIPELSSSVPRLAQLSLAQGLATDETGELPEADDMEDSGVVLLPADQWHCDLPDIVDEIHDFVPSIDVLLNSLIESWIDLTESSYELRYHLANHIGYFYFYDTGARFPAIEHQIHFELREVHKALLEGETSEHANLMTYQSQKHHRAIRDQLLGIC